MKSRINVDKSINKNCALLIVTILKNANVTIEKNNIVLTPKYWVDNINSTLQKAVFTISQIWFDENPWTVTASLGEEVVTKSIIINSIKEYNLLCYKLYLYHNGSINPNNYPQATIIRTHVNYNSSGSSSLTNDNGILSCYSHYSSGNNGVKPYFHTAEKIDITNWNKIVIEVTEVTKRGNGARSFGLYGTITYTEQKLITYDWPDAAVSTLTSYTLDISTAKGPAYIAVRILTGANQTSHYVRIKNWYLET